ncbi:unnamed protein product, partial [marine sediment metagenome]
MASIVGLELVLLDRVADIADGHIPSGLSKLLVEGTKAAHQDGLTLCAIECAPDGTFTIPANNTFQVNADKGTDPQMVKIDQDMVAIFSRDSGNNAWLSTVRITTGDPV